MMSDIIQELTRLLGENKVLTGEAVSSRNSSYWDSSPMRAKAIVRPETTEEVSAVVRMCRDRKQTVVTQGGLTGTVEGAKCGVDDIVLSLERLNKIEAIDPLGRVATVQAGCVLQNVQEAVAEQGLLFPLDLGARGSCTIGGNVSTNAGGINVIRYGMMRDLVLGLEVVLADGTILSSMNRMLKNNAGYDLKQLFIGSEGTLGIVTRVNLKLKEMPVSANSALLAMDDFTQVVELLKFLDKSLGGYLTSYEVMWGNYFRCVTGPGWHVAPMSRDYNFYVVLESEGADQERDRDQFEQVMEEGFAKGLMVDAVLPKSKAERDKVWAIREHFEAMFQYSPSFIYDVSLPIKEMDQYVKALDAALARRWPEYHFFSFGHIGDGNLHFCVSPQQDQSADLHDQVNEIVYRPLQALDGSVSAEHGIGIEKKAFLSLSRNEAEIRLMRTIKQTLDPDNLLNPGKVV